MVIKYDNSVSRKTMWDIILYETVNGHCPIEQFIDSFGDTKLKAKILRDIDLLEDEGNRLKAPHSKSIRDSRGSLFELRSKQSTNLVRIFYYFRKEKEIILLSGFTKKSNKTPIREIKIAFEYKRDWEERNRD